MFDPNDIESFHPHFPPTTKEVVIGVIESEKLSVF
jgi:hypothetical protein